MYGKVTTTKPRATALKAFAMTKVTGYGKLGSTLESKRWLKAEVSTIKYAKRVSDKLKELGPKFAVSMAKTQPRKGDNAPQYEVTIINFDAPKKDEQQN